ncbi:nucleotide disphospho-sugar-binding domain-containing protein [Nocardiopsis sp. Huas11]|uniref:nucleotide disphospho-sugar-binding domain-containing protein n=1 Tax=Nocardiopsis sp. Huas11 TaxID=2183912 RepID=UPI001F25E8F8|nr:nucleotide disphospho-sugar-binding domain-containing protein [Nocardiopsis sp. Huas11]
MVPTAWALRAAGHEVRIGTGPSMTDAAADTGLTVMPVGESADGATEDAAAGPAGRGRAAWWSAVNDPLVTDLVAVCREWEPDLVLWESATLAGAIAAEAVGAAHGRFLAGSDPLVHGRAAAGDAGPGTPRAWLEETAPRFGVSPSDSLLLGRFSVHQLPEGLRSEVREAEGPRLSVRPVPYRGAASLPSWARGEAAGPRVLVDWSSWDRSAEGSELLAAAATGLDAELVVLCPAGREEELPSLPEDVRVADASATHLLLDSASLLVHGGGFDVACAAAAHLLPQVAVLNPAFPDAAALMRPLVERGCAVSLTPAEALGGALRDTVSRALAGADGTAVQALGKEVAATPAPSELVSVLEELAGAAHAS